MKSKAKKISIRTTMTLLLIMLTSINAWADADVIVKYLDPTAAMGAQRESVTNPGQITAVTTVIGSSGNETWYYVSGTVTNSNRIEVKGTVNLILEDGCNFTVDKGINVPSGSALNIYAQSVANRGSLTANNYGNDAAIGGNGGEDGSGTNATAGEDSGAITIYGGTITTFGNIGGGDGGKGTMEPGEFYEPGKGGKGGNGKVTVYSGNIYVNGNIGGGSAGTGQNENGNEDENYYGSNGGGTVNLSWTNTEDRIYAYCYYGTVTLQKAFNGFSEGGVDNNDVLQQATLMHAGDYYIVTIGSMPDGVTAAADLEVNAGWKNAVEGQVVTICFSGVPAGKVPVVYYDYMLGESPQHSHATDNGDGTVSFTMPAADVTITAKKDFKKCTATANNPMYHDGYNIGMFYDGTWNDNHGGIKVFDGETELTYYHYDANQDDFVGDFTTSVVSLDYPDGPDPCTRAGEHCQLILTGQNDWEGTLTIDIEILSLSGSGTWGDNEELTWNYADGALIIGLTNSENGNKSMKATDTYGKYPWYQFCSHVTSITIGEGVTSIANYAFGGQNDFSTYNNVTTVSLPSTLTSIGDQAFRGCTGATITIPTSVTALGNDPFTNVACVVCTLNDGNSNMFSNITTATSATITYKRTFTENVASTICLPFDYTPNGEGTYYTFTAIDKTTSPWTVTMTSTAASLTANTPYMFMPAATGEVTFSGTASNVTYDLSSGDVDDPVVSGGKWNLIGTYATKIWDSTHNNDEIGKIYGFAANSYDGDNYTVSPGDFVKAGSGASIVPFRAYLQYTGPTGLNAPMRGGTRAVESLPNSMKVKLVSADGSVTAVGTINTATGGVSIDKWSDMNGRILPESPAESGMYIHNGKQVLIKY